MKRRTKNFVEDILIIIGVLFILYLIYFFVFSKEPLADYKKQPVI